MLDDSIWMSNCERISLKRNWNISSVNIEKTKDVIEIAFIVLISSMTNSIMKWVKMNSL